MENKQSHLLVGIVALVLLVGLFAFILWLSRFTGEERQRYDLFFEQSVTGLAVGSTVSFSGVPVGQVRQIALLPDAPEFVRVRIEVGEDVPILEGTTGAIQGVGFTGVSEVQLVGATRGAAPIDQPGPFGVPVIPTRASGFTALLESAPEVLERASTLLARLNAVFDDENRRSLSGVLANLDTVTANIARDGPEIRAALIEARRSLEAVQRSADQFARVGTSAERFLEEDARAIGRDLAATSQQAARAVQRIERLVVAAEPALTTVAQDTLPEINQLVRDLRTVTSSLGAVAQRLDEDPLGGFVGGRALPPFDAAGAPRRAPSALPDFQPETAP